MNKYEEKEYDKVILVYNRFKNAATQIVEVESYLPIVSKVKKKRKQIPIIYSNQIKVRLLTSFYKVIENATFKALRDSFASEHGARMTAMHKATDNATELRDQLKLTYNKARQAAITKKYLKLLEEKALNT